MTEEEDELVKRKEETRKLKAKMYARINYVNYPKSSEMRDCDYLGESIWVKKKMM